MLIYFVVFCVVFSDFLCLQLLIEMQFLDYLLSWAEVLSAMLSLLLGTLLGVQDGEITV